MEQAVISKHVAATVRALLAEAIDYAGLFAPSAHTMQDAVVNYATYRNSNYSWMLGRFVVAAARLEEFFDVAEDFIARDRSGPWRVATVAGEDIDDTLRKVIRFNELHAAGAVCDVLEVRASTSSKIDNTVSKLPPGLAAYFELAPDETLPELVAELAIRGQRAKIRTGGVTPDAFPRTEAIVRFVQVCTAAGVEFKATAGLHHPIRCFKPLTYEEDSIKGTMHGFLNLFMMAGFARESYRRNLLEEVMEEEFGEVFEFDDNNARWRGTHEIGLRQIEVLRERGIQSFGSCSFDEPVADLQKLGIL